MECPAKSENWKYGTFDFLHFHDFPENHENQLPVEARGSSWKLGFSEFLEKSLILIDFVGKLISFIDFSEIIVN